jgi:hypothetical protein
LTSQNTKNRVVDDEPDITPTLEAGVGLFDVDILVIRNGAEEL